MTQKKTLQQQSLKAAKPALDAAIAVAMAYLEEDIEAIKVRFKAELADLVAALELLPRVGEAAEDSKPLYAQTGSLDFRNGPYDDRDIELPFAQLSGKYNHITATLTRGWGSAIAEIARQLSTVKDDKLPPGEYRYAIMIFPAEKKDKP